MRKPLLFISSFVAVICIALPSCTYDYLAPLEEEEVVINDSCGWVNITSYIDTTYPYLCDMWWDHCPDSNYHFTNNAQYQQFLDCRSGPCDSLWPSIDFNNYDVLAILTFTYTGSSYRRELYRCDVEHKYKYVVNVTEGHNFFMIDDPVNLILIPKIPQGYSVVFEENYL